MRDFIEDNRKHWEELAELHPKTDYYDVAGFLDGKSTLDPIEPQELDSVEDKSLLHLQCHFGLDTLSWARRGAAVTGVDFSSEAVETARELAVEAGLEYQARFVQADVYELADGSPIEAKNSISYTRRLGYCSGCPISKSGLMSWLTSCAKRERSTSLTIIRLRIYSAGIRQPKT